jgi:hypothetical protein
MGAGAAGAAKHRDAAGAIEQLRQGVEVLIIRPDDRFARGDPLRRLGVGGLERNITRDHHDRDTAIGNRPPDRLLEDPRHLVGVGYEFDVVAAFPEQNFRMRGLKIGTADFRARDVCRDREDGYPAAMAVEEPVDQMEIPGPAAPRADRQLTGQMRLGPGRKRRGFLVPHMDPLNFFLPAQGVGEAVQRVADHAIDATNADGMESLGHQLRNGLCHSICSCSHMENGLGRDFITSRSGWR